MGIKIIFKYFGIHINYYALAFFYYYLFIYLHITCYHKVLFI